MAGEPPFFYRYILMPVMQEATGIPGLPAFMEMISQQAFPVKIKRRTGDAKKNCRMNKGGYRMPKR
jgi:hypothetical protein